MNKRPDILYLVHRVPYPPNRGDRIRSFHLLEFLAQRANVHLATLADEPVSDETMAVLRQRCRRVEIQPVGKGRWIRGALSLAAGASVTEGLFRSPRLHRTVEQWSRDTHFDTAVVFCSSMAPYLSAPNLREVPAIIDLVDVDSQKWFDYAAKTRGPKKSLYQIEGARLRRLERHACERAAAITLVSEAEAELFRRICPNDHTYSIPNGVDLDYFHPQPGDGIPGRCVFVGALDYRANIDGITWFCREVWPGVRAVRPDATLAIVGRNPAQEVKRLSSVASVEVFGSVSDVRPHLRDANIAIAPLRIARGVQNKVLEAMASRRPVVASPEALEGLAVDPIHEVTPPSLSDDWQHCLCKLMQDASERAAIAHAGRSFVETHHSWRGCLAPLARLLRVNIPYQCYNEAASWMTSGVIVNAGN